MTPKENNFIERSLQQFADMMIEKIESLKSSDKWQQPWFTEGGMLQPVNMDGRSYNGMNSIILMLTAEKKHYDVPVWGTYNRLTALNYQQGEGSPLPLRDKDGNDLPKVTVNKGEHGSNVYITTFIVIHKETKEKIPYETYRQMNHEEQQHWAVYPRLNVYRVFNICQTNLKEVRPELWQKYVDRYTNKPQEHVNSFRMSAMDKMISNQSWLCPVNLERQDKAFYSISKDAIMFPLFEQFKDGESFYANLAHEMAHSTGRKNNLNRFTSENMGNNDFIGREELVAELTSALVMARAGVVKHLKDDSAVYLKSWLESLRESPKFIKNVLQDVKNAAALIEEAIAEADKEVIKPAV